jgi:nucleoside-diphosphate-sugar epimerase
MSAADQQQRARQLIAELEASRARRDREKPWSGEMPEGEWKPDFNDPLPLIFFGYTDFWAVIHEEDSAQALEKGLTADYMGSHPLFVADSVNMLNVEAEMLARIFYPEATRTRPLVGAEPLVSYDKARKLIGYEPEHSSAERLE